MFLLSHMLKKFIRKGTLRIHDADGKLYSFGDETEPVVTLRFHDKSLAFKIFKNPELHTGEAYMDGTLTFEDSGVYDLLTLFGMNRHSLGSYPLQNVLRKVWKAFRTLQQHNPAKKSQQDVAHHYDLSRRLYELFLDEDLQYSCAYFLSPQDSLEEAQANKKRHIAAKLRLQDGQKILDIGCGWGGMALYLASLAEVEVTGVTLSKEQLEVARARAKELGLDHRVKFELQDYRHLEGPFDRIVSVGMFEHVGVGHYDEFFTKVKSLLSDDGLALIHSIGHMSPPGTTGPWIRKYIFPGGYSPSLSEVCAATERAYLWVTDVEVLRMHYADTLKAWRDRFEANRAEIEEIYDARFCRMWEFYLISAEMAFRRGSSMVLQIQLSKECLATPITRDYMHEAEARLPAPFKAPDSASRQGSAAREAAELEKLDA